MIHLIALLVIISLSLYIINAMNPVYLFLKKKYQKRLEGKRIQDQTIILERRGATLLALGFRVDMEDFMIRFRKASGASVGTDQLRGWSDKKFNSFVEEHSNEK